MKQLGVVCSILLCFCSVFSRAQTLKDIKLNNGFVSYMNTVEIIDTMSNNWINDNLLHNRFNFNWSDEKKGFKVVAELRNRLLYGDRVKLDPFYTKQISEDNGMVDLSYNLIKGNSFILNTAFDRLNFSYEKDNYLFTVGRQRINWSFSFVWSPNDLFNNASFYDFDYVEKPGSDALRFQYFASPVSSLDAVMKFDKNMNITAAAMYRLNKFGYDFQALGGVLASKDLAVGLGWSGDLNGGSFTGELSYFYPMKKSDKSTFLGSLGYSYTFSNELFLYGEFMYMTIKDEDKNKGFNEFWAAPQSIKNLSITEYNLVFMGEYPITSLLKSSISMIYYPKLQGVYLSPSIDYSLTQNMDMSFIGQFFSANVKASELVSEVHRTSYTIINLRLKWNF